MDLDKIQRLLELVAASGMAEVKVEEGDFKLTVRSPSAMPAAAPAPVQMTYAAPPPAPLAAAPAAAAVAATTTTVGSDPAAEPGSGDHEALVLAPIVGTFYEASSPDAAPFVKVGDRVEVGQPLCIIEAMKLMNEIQSEVAGTVRQILAQNAAPVEYDQPLFVIETA
ncbi:MAG TPA: acetyl-CoA carboxylase biotin carboxyl carrier protein [Rubricoccaceae bacterium]